MMPSPGFVGRMNFPPIFVGYLQTLHCGLQAKTITFRLRPGVGPIFCYFLTKDDSVER
jgi:hypothetical protein